MEEGTDSRRIGLGRLMASQTPACVAPVQLVTAAYLWRSRGRGTSPSWPAPCPRNSISNCPAAAAVASAYARGSLPGAWRGASASSMNADAWSCVCDICSHAGQSIFVSSYRGGDCGERRQRLFNECRRLVLCLVMCRRPSCVRSPRPGSLPFLCT